MTKLKYLFVALVAVFALAACESGVAETLKEDQSSAKRSLERYQTVQPVPEFEWSQLRQNLIELQTGQAQTTQTTTFFFNLGVVDPIAVCPSIGYPIPSTAQLTNPEQAIGQAGSGDGEALTLPLIENTGVYTGDSTGTYVICVDANGNAYADYWEGFVKTVSGPAEWRDGQVVLTGPPTGGFTTGQDR